MNEKEVSEIRRRYRADKSNITYVHGCYVNSAHEIVSRFTQPVSMMTESEQEKYLGLMKRSLSGTLGKNLLDITFSSKQVLSSDEHRLLSTLRNTSLRDEDALRTFYEKVVQALAFEGNYVILLAHDSYDVPYRSKDGQMQDDASSDVYSYILCSICPVKQAKPALSYSLQDALFHSRDGDWLVSAPELGFLFPAFDNRSTNLYNALYYSHNIQENHNELIDAIFCTEAPMPAAVQQQTFQSVLSNTLGSDCSYNVVQSVHEHLTELIETHKANKEEDPLTIRGGEVSGVLRSCGVSGDHVSAFSEKFDAEFGEDTALSPRNIVSTSQFEVRTPDVVIRVKPERSDLIETRIIGGCRYILIQADEGVEVNGVSIEIKDT